MKEEINPKARDIHDQLGKKLSEEHHKTGETCQLVGACIRWLVQIILWPKAHLGTKAWLPSQEPEDRCCLDWERCWSERIEVIMAGNPDTSCFLQYEWTADGQRKMVWIGWAICTIPIVPKSTQISNQYQRNGNETLPGLSSLYHLEWDIVWSTS